MAVRAHLTSGGEAVIIQPDGEESLYRWHLGNEVDEVETPRGPEDWLRLGRIMHGLFRIADKDGNFSPEVGPDFPLLKPKDLDGGERIYVVSGTVKEDGTEVPD